MSSSSAKPFRRPQPNQEQVVDIELVGERDITRVIDASLGLEPAALNTFRMVRFVRVRADEKSADAALAEVEVTAAGDNISLGVLARGGELRQRAFGTRAAKHVRRHHRHVRQYIHRPDQGRLARERGVVGC